MAVFVLDRRKNRSCRARRSVHGCWRFFTNLPPDVQAALREKGR